MTELVVAALDSFVALNKTANICSQLALSISSCLGSIP